MSGNKKRQLQSYLEQKRERFDEIQKLSYHDRMRVMEQEWSQNFWLEDANPEKQARVEMETGADPSIQNAIFRVNTASQKPSTEQIDSFIREEKQRSKDRFLKLVETIDDLSAKIKEIEPQAMQAFASAQQLHYFTDLRLGSYDARKDAELIRQHCEAEPEVPAAETQTTTETQTPAESKPETQTEVKPADAKPETQTEVKPADAKPESATETQTTPETKSEAPAESKPEVKSETPAESKPETQTPTEIKPTEANLETTPENKSSVKNETPTEVKTEPKPETQTAPEVKPEIKPEAAAGPVSVNA